MRVSVCVGKYAKIPYSIRDLEIHVYSMEELCYVLKENAFLLDMSLLDENLVNWIDTECGLEELARELYPLVRKQGSLSAFVTMIQEYVGLYDRETIYAVECVLKEGSGLSSIEKRKNQIDYLVRKNRYPAAVHSYDDLLSKWAETEEKGEQMPGSKVKAAILHNKGVALAGMMEYAAAAECFGQAYETDPTPQQYQAFLAAKRVELNESEYLSFVAERPECYEMSLQLEKIIEEMKTSFPEQLMAKQLADLKECREGMEKQKYYNEVERITRSLKEGYRSSVSE